MRVPDRAEALAPKPVPSKICSEKFARLLRDSFSLFFNVIQAVIRVSGRRFQWLSRPFKDLLRAHDCLREISGNRCSTSQTFIRRLEDSARKNDLLQPPLPETTSQDNVSVTLGTSHGEKPYTCVMNLLY
jgi:hypothetical protein